MRGLTTSMIILSLLLVAAIFGFFYAWVCSTMWGLDAADPRVAIRAMQAMNGSVRNIVFAPAFFGPPVMLALTAVLLAVEGSRNSAIAFALAGAVYLCFGLAITLVLNVPMNAALAAAVVPESPIEADVIWQDYSGNWQFWNQIRTVASGIAFLLAMWGLHLRAAAPNPDGPLGSRA